MELSGLFQSADWKKEKHMPVIEAEKVDDKIKLRVSVGKEIAHPNTVEHHISWIEVYFLPEGEKFPHQIGKFEFASHGASVQGAGVYTDPAVGLEFRSKKPGTILASSYCNIHGLWQSFYTV
jgi:superoxide reductase